MEENKINDVNAEEVSRQQISGNGKLKGKKWRYNYLFNLYSKGLLKEYSDEWYEFKLNRYNNRDCKNTKNYIIKNLKEDPNFKRPVGLLVKEDLIDKYNELKNNKKQEGIEYPNFDFSLVPDEIFGSCDKFTLICLDLKKDKSSIIGDWVTDIHRLFSGYLPKEFSQMHMVSKKWTKDAFIKKSKEIYGENVFDYSNIEFTSISKKVKNLKCNKCGSIISPVGSSHIAGHGCPTCARKEIAEKRALGREEFIRRSKNLFGENSFDYSRVIYKNSSTKVDLFCNKCKTWFSQTPTEHLLSKCGCPNCSRKNAADQSKLTNEEFIEKARQVHGYLYDYSKVEYKGGRVDVLIIDTETGEEFWQKPELHLSGHGNPRRNDSKGEKLIRTWLKSINTDSLSWKSEVTIKNISFHSRDFVRIDFIVNFKGTVFWIEYNGEQHYKFSYRSRIFKYYSSKEKAIEAFKKQIERDAEVKQYCINNNIVFVEIPYTYKTFNSISDILNKVIIDGEKDLSFIRIPKVEISNLYNIKEEGQENE